LISWSLVLSLTPFRSVIHASRSVEISPHLLQRRRDRVHRHRAVRDTDALIQHGEHLAHLMDASIATGSPWLTM